MVTSYILILIVSAWLIAYGLTLTLHYVAQLVRIAVPPSAPSIIALAVTLALFVVAAAPSWTIVIALLLLAMPHRYITYRLPSSVQQTFILTILAFLMATPLAGAPSWVALDSAVLASALLGVRCARSTPSSLGATFFSYLFLLLWLISSTVVHFFAGAMHAS